MPHKPIRLNAAPFYLRFLTAGCGIAEVGLSERSISVSASATVLRGVDMFWHSIEEADHRVVSGPHLIIELGSNFQGFSCFVREQLHYKLWLVLGTHHDKPQEKHKEST